MYQTPKQSADLWEQLANERNMLDNMLQLLSKEERWCQGALHDGFTQHQEPIVCLLGAASLATLQAKQHWTLKTLATMADIVVPPCVILRLARAINQKVIDYEDDQLPHVANHELLNFIADFNDSDEFGYQEVIQVLQVARASIEEDVKRHRFNFWLDVGASAG